MAREDQDPTLDFISVDEINADRRTSELEAQGREIEDLSSDLAVASSRVERIESIIKGRDTPLTRTEVEMMDLGLDTATARTGINPNTVSMNMESIDSVSISLAIESATDTIKMIIKKIIKLIIHTGNWLYDRVTNLFNNNKFTLARAKRVLNDINNPELTFSKPAMVICGTITKLMSVSVELGTNKTTPIPIKVEMFAKTFGFYSKSISDISDSVSVSTKLLDSIVKGSDLRGVCKEYCNTIQFTNNDIDLSKTTTVMSKAGGAVFYVDGLEALKTECGKDDAETNAILGKINDISVLAGNSALELHKRFFAFRELFAKELMKTMCEEVISLTTAILTTESEFKEISKQLKKTASALDSKTSDASSTRLFNAAKHVVDILVKRNVGLLSEASRLCKNTMDLVYGDYGTYILTEEKFIERQKKKEQEMKESGKEELKVAGLLT